MKSTIVVVGIPESGKSSFIAALSHILQFGEIETVLTLSRLAEEDKYLYEMRQKWQGCKPFERTRDGIHPITLHLRNQNGKESTLSFPDVGGEEFEQQWSNRIWNSDYLQTIKEAYGVLLFVNAGNLDKPLSIVDKDNLSRSIIEAIGDDYNSLEDDTPSDTLDAGEALVQQITSQSDASPRAKSDHSIWNPRLADQQAKIVDVLQSISEFDIDRQWKLGIAISAWDIVRELSPTITPRLWLERNQPYLWQFLQSNTNLFNFETFGVSAQGGDPVKDSARLQAHEAQSERVLVEYNGYTGHDLTRIVAWVMDSADF
jgi:hypothetical protein